MPNWAYISLVVLFVALVIGFLGYYFENRPSSNERLVARMMADLQENKDKFKDGNKSAFVLGYTGEVGKEIVKEILSSKIFSHVVLIGRRQVKYEDDMYKDVEQKVVDFEKLDEYADAFRGFDVGFCSLGSTRRKAGGGDEFYHIDHDYVVNSAKLAKDGGCQQFHLVSSMGANAKSSNLYWKTKGETEQHIKEIGFDHFITYRPGTLMCNREESRPAESVARFFLKPVSKMFPTFITTPTKTCAQAMINAAVVPLAEPYIVMENKDIFKLAEGSIKSTEDGNKND